VGKDPKRFGLRQRRGEERRGEERRGEESRERTLKKSGTTRGRGRGRGQSGTTKRKRVGEKQK